MQHGLNCGMQRATILFSGMEQKGSPVVNRRKLLRNILAHPKNVRFADMVNLVQGFGFGLSRRSGSHHVFVHPDVPEVLNLQEVKGEAKPYQIRQFLKIVEKRHLELED